MKLTTKFALYSTASKLLIFAGFGALLPVIIREVSISHMDNRLLAKQEKVMHIIGRGDISQITEHESCSFGNYNLLKEEFITILPASSPSESFIISQGTREVGGEVFDFRILTSTFHYENQTYRLEIGEGLNDLNHLDKTLRSLLLWAVVLVSFLAFIADLGYSGILLRPLKKLIRQKLTSVKHPGEFDFSPIKTSTTDFKQLDDTINGMMKKVQEAFEVEKQFIANVSHELLTPISILQNRFENLIAEGSLTHEAEQKVLESLKTLSRLGKIIKTLLMISKIENDQFLRQDHLKLKEFLEEVVSEIKDRLEDRKIKLSWEWQGDHELSKCNRTLLFTMFFNLMNNAIRYNVEAGSIIVKGKPEGDKFKVEIEDKGQGIEEEHLKDIFSRFKRFRIKDNESYGLGLPIVKTICTFHGVEISIQSMVGKGTSVGLLFPGK